LCDHVVPAASELLGVLNDPKLDASEKLKKIGDAIGRNIQAAIVKVPDLIEDAVPKMIGAGVTLGGGLAKGVVKGFAETDLLGKLLMGGAAIRMFGGPGALTRTGLAIGSPMGTGAGKGFTNSMSQFAYASLLSGGGIKGMASTTGALASKAYSKAMMSGVARSIPGLVATYSVADVATTAISEGVEPGLRKAGFTAAFALLGGIAGGLPGAAIGSGIGDALESALFKSVDVEKIFRERIQSVFNTNWVDFSKQRKNILDELDKVPEDLKKLDPDYFKFLRESTVPSAKKMFSDIWEDLSPSDRQLAKTSFKVRTLKDRLGEKGIDIPLRVIEENPREMSVILKRMSNNIAAMESGAITDLDSIGNVSKRTGKLIAQTLGRDTVKGKKALARNMRATAAAMMNAMDRTGHHTKTGMAKVRRLLDRADLVDPTRQQARKMARTWARGMNTNAKVTDEGVQKMIRKLRRMTPEARQIAVKTWLAQVREARKGGDLSARNYQQMKSKVLAAFTGLSTGASKATANMADRTKGSSQRAEKTAENLAKAYQRSSRKIKTAISAIPEVAQHGYGALAGATNTALAAFGSNKKVSLSYRSGGSTIGHGVVDAMVSPGEMVEFRGKRWIVPGKRVAKDNVHARLPVGARVFTDDGQHRLAAGMNPQRALREQKPHFGPGAPSSPLERFAAGGTAGNAAAGRSRDIQLASSKLPKLRMVGGAPAAPKPAPAV